MTTQRSTHSGTVIEMLPNAEFRVELPNCKRMKSPVFWDKITEPVKDFYERVEYFFAKRWLNKKIRSHGRRTRILGQFLLIRLLER